MKRILIAGGIGLFGMILLPSMRAVAEAISDNISGAMTGAKYGSFIVLVGDNIYLVMIVAWIAVMGAILFWPTGDRHDAQLR